VSWKNSAAHWKALRCCAASLGSAGVQAESLMSRAAAIAGCGGDDSLAESACGNACSTGFIVHLWGAVLKFVSAPIFPASRLSSA
jgi:hypothetical protein